MPDQKDDNLKMADRRKAIKVLYSGDDQLKILTGRTPAGASSNFFNEATLEEVMQAVSINPTRFEQTQRISNYAYATEPNYAEMIDYLANIYLWRYYYIPIKIREKANQSEYSEIYNLMGSVIDGLNVEYIYPMILTKLLKDGVVYMYTTKDTPSKTISTFLLNAKYCSPVMTSQYGTGIFQFDVRYFDSFGLSGQDLEEVLTLFPEELVQGYREYKANIKQEKIGPNQNNYWVVLDGRYSTYVQLNDYNFPKKLSVLRSIFDYNQYRKNELEKSTSELDHVLTHKIPTYEDRLLFELPEVKELHASMSRLLSNTKRIRLLTTFGDTDIKPLQSASGVQNNTLERANEAIYYKAGMNSNVFTGSTKTSLELSIIKDASIMWKYIQQLTSFYNLAINNLYNFKGYQIEFNLIPITAYNEKDKMELLRRNAEYGIGRLEAVVASGTKQKSLQAKADLEEFLKLDEILKPLVSSHTQSGKTEEKVEESEEEITDIEEQA